MMILNMLLTLLFLAFSSTILIAEASSDISIRMNPSKFHKILKRESLTELASMSVPERQKSWWSTSKEYFKSEEACVDTTQSCSVPFLFCNSTPDQNGHERKVSLHSMMMMMSEDALSDKEYVELEELPLINTEEETCFIASMPPEIATSLANSSCESNEKNCVIHPLLPMMKLSYGTVDLVSTTIQNEEDPYLTIIAELSPYHKQNNADISLIIQLSEDNCERHLAYTLPSTGKTMGCAHSLESSEIEVDWLTDTIIALNLSPSTREGQTESDLKEKVLRFISGLAVRPEFSTIETTSSELYYTYSYN